MNRRLLTVTCTREIDRPRAAHRGKEGAVCVCVFSPHHLSYQKNHTSRVCAAEAVAKATGERAALGATRSMGGNYTLSLRIKYNKRLNDRFRCAQVPQHKLYTITPSAHYDSYFTFMSNWKSDKDFTTTTTGSVNNLSQLVFILMQASLSATSHHRDKFPRRTRSNETA